MTDSENLVANASLLMQRLQLENGVTHNGKRNLYEIFGYKKELSPQDFRYLHERQDIASRITTAYPDAVWSNPPLLIEDENSQDDTEAEKNVKKLFKELRMWHYLTRADTLAQLGRFSLLYVGIGDGKEIDEEVGAGLPQYLMPFGENNVEIISWEQDTRSAQYGKPLKYRLTVTNDDDSDETLEVHASRCIHIAERTLDSDIYGQSILKPIYNRLADLEKVAGGGSEVWWLNARGGINANVDKDVTIKEPEKLAAEFEDFVNNLTRIIKTKGVDVKTLSQQTDSPKDQADLLLQLISGTTGIPKRILIGSEAGELASTQDEDNWASRVDERRKTFCGPCILEQILSLFVRVGAIPDIEWNIEWPDLIVQSEEKQAAIAKNKTDALVAYANSTGADMIIPPEQFVEEILKEEYREDDIAKALKDEDNEIKEETEIE